MYIHISVCVCSIVLPLAANVHAHPYHSEHQNEELFQRSLQETLDLGK